MLMLVLHRPRCTFHSSQLFSIRTFRTVPRRIPTYVKQWNPTLHKSTRQHDVTIKPPTCALKTPVHDTVQVATQEELRKEIRFKLENRGLSAENFYKHWKLKHVLHLATTSTKIGIASVRVALWKAYRIAKLADEPITSILSHRAWNVIWTSQAIRSFQNRKRTVRLEELYDDMVSAGCTPSITQRVEYLECLFLNGKEQEAVNEWEADHQGSGGHEGQSSEPEHLEMGAKLYAWVGHADRAREIMDKLFEMYPDWKSSVMVSVFRTHTSSDLTKHHNDAKEIYDKMKVKLSTEMTLEDYDACFVGFLEARHLHYAKAVFRDMVKDGFIATTSAARDVEGVLKRLHMLYHLGTDIASMTSIALDAIDVLPKEHHGHLFGDWMKLAVVQNTPEAAAQILDMMFTRGYTPETFHFNMLLRALMRTKETPNVLKAENIGWRMIDETRKAHKRTLGSNSGGGRTSASDDSLQPQNLDAARNLPAADVTTFALLMHHHAKALQWEYVDYLSRQLKNTSIVPNATIMNVLIDNKTRQGAYAEAWATYKQLTQPSKPGVSTGVFPNGATMRLLWKTLRFALGDHATRHDTNLPTARELLKESLEWWDQCNYRYDAERFRTGLSGANHGAISALVLHCFSYTQDVAGSLVAMHALRHKFGIFPTDNDATILQRQLAWVDMSRESATTGEQYFHSRSNQRNRERILRIYQMLLKRRLDDIKSEEEAMRMTDEDVGDFGLNVLSEFVRVVMKRQYPEDIVETMIEATKRDVGYQGETGDLKAHEVW
jgi:hypothetical protein